MQKMKDSIGAAAVNAGKTTKKFLAKTKDAIVKAADQNDDGSLDIKDVAVVADSVGSAARGAVSAIRKNAENRNREAERKNLRPIFPEDLSGADFLLSKLIRITEIDKKHAESEVCQGSIGYITEQKDLQVMNFYKSAVDTLGLSFFPDTDSEIYYVDPSDRDRYISLDDYFAYLKVARVSELQKIAQDLGAKHFRVIYKEHEKSSAQNAAKAKGTLKCAGSALVADAEHDHSTSTVSNIEVAAEMQFLGHAPTEPKLFYLQREPCIQSLIALRMDKSSPMLHQTYTLKLSNSSGIKEKDAIKIDAALKAMKVSGNLSVVQETLKESQRSFEYEIDF